MTVSAGKPAMLAPNNHRRRRAHRSATTSGSDGRRLLNSPSCPRPERSVWLLVWLLPRREEFHVSRQTGVYLARLAAAGAQPAGPPPLPPASGDVTEVDRTVNASGNVSLGDRIISAGLPLAGQRVTLRLDGPVAHVLAGGVLVRTVACPSRPRPGPGCAEPGPGPPSRPPARPSSSPGGSPSAEPSWSAARESRSAWPTPARPSR